MSECDWSDISSELIRSTVCKTTETLVKSSNYKIKVDSASKAGSKNFVGIVNRIQIHGNGVEDRLNSLILKIAPQNAAHRERWNSRSYFLREIYMYNEIFPIFQSFEESKGLTNGESTFMEYPKCYQTLDIVPDECILLEDLNIRQFKSVDRKTVGSDHARLYLRAIAKFHAISLTLRDQQPIKFHEMTSNLRDVVIDRDNIALRELFSKQTEYLLKLFSGNEYADLLAKLTNFFVKDTLDLFVDAFDSEFNEPHAIVSHGDTNFANCMFRYDSEKKPIEICLIDFQISRLSSPVTDVAWFIFMNITKEIRDSHYESLLKDYHQTLSKHIRTLGSDPEKLFSYEMMQNHLVKYAKYAISIITLHTLPLLTPNLDDSVNLDELADHLAIDNQTNTTTEDRLSQVFNTWMRDVVIDMSRLGYI